MSRRKKMKREMSMRTITVVKRNLSRALVGLKSLQEKAAPKQLSTILQQGKTASRYP